jgi:hypothetical protein
LAGVIPQCLCSRVIARHYLKKPNSAAGCSLLAQVINGSANGAYQVAPAFRQPEIAFAVSEESRLMGQVSLSLRPKMGYPMWIITINAPRKVVKVVLVGRAADLVDREHEIYGYVRGWFLVLAA